MAVKEKYVNPFTDFGFKKLFVSSFPIQEQAQTGDWNYRLSPIYTVGILDFAFSADETTEEISNKPLEVRHEVQLKNQNGKVFYDKLTYIYLEMPHFTKTEEELETTYDKWLFVLKYLPDLPDRPKNLQEKIFQKLFEAAEIAKFTPEEKEQYEESLKSYRDLKNVIDTAFDEGEAKGKIEEKITNIVRALKRGKLSVEEIAEDFETTVEFVLKVKATHNL